MSEAVKKRKWDQDDNSGDSHTNKVTKVEKDPSKAVSEAAARINAILAQKGIATDDDKVSGLSEIGVSKNDGEYVKDIPINDLKNRYMLTRGATQTQIAEETGADVITRGKYYPDIQLASDREPPLYLHITAKNKESLDKAVAKIQDLIENSQVPAPGSGYPPREERPDMMKRPERKFYERRIPVGIDGPTHFNLRAKIVGPNGAFVKHIQQETGCRVQLKGKGSGFYESATGVESEDPMNVHVSCAREEGLEAGIKLTNDLLDTVRAEAKKGPPANQYGYNNRGGGYNSSGYSGHYNNNHYSGYNNAGTSSPASSAASADPAAQNYDYSSYYGNYYQQPQGGQQQYSQYDTQAYYAYYGYAPVDPNASSATPPPPPASSAAMPPSSPPPPPPASSSPPPPPPPPSSDA